jgi:hypothetical protein
MNLYILLRKNTSAVFKGIAMLFLLFSIHNNAFAQRPYGNEWIYFEQPYWKIKIAKDGAYRLNYNDLKTAGVDIDNLQPNFFQLFYRGQQIPIYVKGETDSVFNSTDFIEFYGLHNDGGLDSVLYAKPSDQSHPYYSTYTDTSAYFLTWGYYDEPLRIKDFSYSNPGNKPVNLITEQKLTFFNEVYQDGVQIDPLNNFITSEYTLNEGWQSKDILIGKSRDVVITTDNADVSSSQKPVLEFRINSRSDVWRGPYDNVAPDHNLVVEVKSNTGTFREVYNVTYDGFKTNIESIPLEWSDLGTNITVRVSSKGVSGAAQDVHTISYIRVKYPKKLNLSAQINKPFEFTQSNADTFTHFNVSKTKLFKADNIVLFDVTNGYRAYPSIMPDSVRYTLPNNGTSAKYLIYDTSNITQNLSLTPVTFKQIDLSEDYDYLIVTHKFYANAAQEFAAYKQSQKNDSSGNYKVLVADVDDLYNQFFYGMKHPAAIQNFSAYVYNKQAKKPQYLLLLGKGYEITKARATAAIDYVPTIGNPTSELLFTAGIDNGFEGLDLTLDPKMAIGRIAAHNEDEVRIYLDKLKEYDSAPKALWKKEILHVGGGLELSLQNISKGYLNAEKLIAEGDSIGASVHSYFSETADVINTDKRAAIQNDIETGSAMLTYFGHAAGTVLGVAIADFNSLSNKGKYPIMYLNGCNVGNPALSSKTMADDYLFTPDKGAVSWISHANTTFTNKLNEQMEGFYTHMSKDEYGGTVGQVWRKTLADYKLPINLQRAAAYAWVIQGDPSLRFPFLHLPDYAISDTSIFISPTDVDATAEAFDIAIPVSNLGKTDTLPFSIVVKQEYPDGSSHIYDAQKIPPIRFADTVLYHIVKGNVKLQGLNKFDIIIDSDSAVTEEDETNNTAHFEYYFPGTGIRVLYPLNYGIEPGTKPDLVAQSRDLFDTVINAIFEIDTIPTFNSGFKQNSGLVAGKNIHHWSPQLLAKDSTVYYWRARLNLAADSGGSWETRSFTYINSSPAGWSQSHFPQYKGITGDNVFVDTLNRKFSFQPKSVFYNLWANAFVGAQNYTGILPEDDQVQTGCLPNPTSLVFIEYDRNTLAPQDTPINCIYGAYHFKSFYMPSATSRADFVKSIDSVKNGNYVFLATFVGKQHVKEWEPEVFKAFEKIGSKMLAPSTLNDTILNHDSVAFVIAGLKAETTGTLLAEDFKYDSIKAQDSTKADFAHVRVMQRGIKNATGFITSEPIGQASKWKAVYQHYRAVETNGKDRYYLQVISTDSAGKDTVLIDNITTTSFDLTGIDAKQFPIIRLRAYLEDSVQKTPPQLKMWTVLYDGIPEGTLLVDNKYKFENTQLAQGDSISINIRYENISKYPMTDLVVLHQVQDEANNIKVNDYDTLKALQPGAFVYISKSVATNDLSGRNIYSLRVNPNFQQPEITLDNNIIRRSLQISSDISNPLLDVTFDGRHILNYDYVSPNVNIEVSAMDDNMTLLLTDTANFTLMLNPANDSARRIYFSNPNVTFTPASASDSKAHISIKPGPLANGDYFFSAQVKDNSGNFAGTQAYNIYFKVDHKAAISSFYIYPNPVTSNAKFVFTVTGENLPQINGIEIYTSTGKLVTMISGSALGKLHLGSNEITWNGTDMNGNLLSDGLYLYRINMSGPDLPKYLLPQDKQLDSGYGKILLMRER